MRTLRPALTPAGDDAYCHVCWHAIYIFWIDDEPPAGRCPNGAASALDCPEAKRRDAFAAQIAKLRRDGLIAPARDRALAERADGPAA